MAKMLDALKSADAPLQPAPAAGVVEPSSPLAAASPLPFPEEGEELPFIEVGAPNRRIEGSPEVLADPDAGFQSPR